MKEKRISHEEYLSCSLILFAQESPSGTFETQKILNVIKPNDLTHVVYKAVFNACDKLWSNNRTVDISSIIAEVKAFGVGASDIMLLAESHYTTTSWEYHLDELHELVRKTAILRCLQREISEIGSKSVDDIKETLEELFSQSNIESDSLVNSDDVYESMFGEAESIIPTCIPQLDEALGGGGEAGQMLVMACRPGHGKTSVASQMVTNRMNSSHRSLIFNMEMGGKPIYARIIAQNSGMDLGYIKRCRKIGVNAVENVKQAFNVVRDRNTIHSKGSMTPEFIRREIQADIFRCEREGLPRPELVVVDYLHLIKSKDTANGLNEGVGGNSRALKCIAVDLKVFMVVLSQMSREIEKRENPMPRNSDLRDSGAIEADADTIVFVHRPAKFSKDLNEQNEEGQMCELIISKQREGASGGIPITFYPRSGRWI